MVVGALPKREEISLVEAHNYLSPETKTIPKKRCYFVFLLQLFYYFGIIVI